MAKKQIKKSSNPILDTILAKLNEAFEELSREAKVAYKSKEFAKALENVLIALFGTTLSTFLLSALFVGVTALIQIVFKLDSVYSALLINITIVSLIITIKDMDFFRNIADSQGFLDKGNEKIKMRKKRTKQLADLDEENEIQESDAK